MLLASRARQASPASAPGSICLCYAVPALHTRHARASTCSPFLLWRPLPSRYVVQTLARSLWLSYGGTERTYGEARFLSSYGLMPSCVFPLHSMAARAGTRCHDLPYLACSMSRVASAARETLSSPLHTSMQVVIFFSPIRRAPVSASISSQEAGKHCLNVPPHLPLQETSSSFR